MNYMGIEHHRQFSSITLMDEGGEILRSGKVVSLGSELDKFLEGIDEAKAVVKTGGRIFCEEGRCLVL